MLYYDKMQVNYSRAMFEINSRYESAGESGMFVHLSTLSSSGEIHFARHGNIPDADGEKYIAPIFLLHADTLTAAVYRSGERISPYFSQTFAANRALGKPVTLRKGPSPSYNTGGAMTLVDGIKGRTPWTGAEWLGWWGDTLDATIDLGKVDTVKSVRLVTLQDQGSWIYYPQEVNVFLSEDGVNFTSASTELNQTNTPENRAYFWYIKAKKARYVRVVAYGKGMIPPGKSGAGYPAWLFASEIIIQ
jgi:hexosaminidase